MKMSRRWLGLVGGVAVLAANTEYWAEQALWDLEGHQPRGVKHRLEGQPSSEVRNALRALANQHSDPLIGPLLLAWCEAADPLYSCRNNILHAVSVGLGDDSVMLIKGPSWKGEIRKKTGSFSGDEDSLVMLEGAFNLLLRSILHIGRVAGGRASLSSEQLALALKALRSARDLGAELADPMAYNPTMEKY